MILKKAILYVTGVAALGAAAIVCVVALASALHAALEPYVGAAWASAAVAAGAALLFVILAFVLISLAHGPRKQVEERDPLSRLIDLAREKPWIAAGAVAAGAAVIMKNPKITAAVLSALMAGRASKK